MENWKPVCGFEERYEVSDQGNVRRKSGGRGAIAGKVLSPYWTGKHWCIGMGTSREDVRNYKIHLLVLEAFVGPRPEGMQGLHNDGDPNHNDAANLRWDTAAENMYDLIRIDRRPRTKLNPTIIRIIRHLFGRLSYREIADLWGVTENYIGQIKCGRHWGWS